MTWFAAEYDTLKQSHTSNVAWHPSPEVILCMYWLLVLQQQQQQQQADGVRTKLWVTGWRVQSTVLPIMQGEQELV